MRGQPAVGVLPKDVRQKGKPTCGQKAVLLCPRLPPCTKVHPADLTSTQAILEGEDGPRRTRHSQSQGKQTGEK